ncbi:hypothetical protein RND81_13G058100 [Saponaria officinalis]|uniref:DUF7890 domain-containing protein n=1 Tax=Saponaria officinalis TaxID=3572 RepID=A0AAW1H4D7_SAPOF
MFTKFVLENFLGTFTKKSQTPKYICMDEHKIKNKVSTRKLHKNGKVMDSYYQGHPLEMKQALVQKGEIKGIQKKNENRNKNNKSNNNNNAVRVKVLMTKEEAAKLLAKCKKEGTLEFKDVVNELAKIPAQRVSVVSLKKTTSKEIELDSIFEEEELI